MALAEEVDKAHTDEADASVAETAPETGDEE